MPVDKAMLGDAKVETVNKDQTSPDFFDEFLEKFEPVLEKFRQSNNTEITRVWGNFPIRKFPHTLHSS